MGRPRMMPAKNRIIPIELTPLEVANLFPVGPWSQSRLRQGLDVRTIHAVDLASPSEPICGTEKAYTPRTTDMLLVTCEACKRMARRAKGA